jgi:hypothetical protein
MIEKKKYVGPDRRDSLVDRRHYGLYGKYLQWLFRKKKRFYILIWLSGIGWAYIFIEIGIWLERHGITRAW